MENYENNNNEISLLDIWNKIWKNKFLVIIITAVILILGTVVLYIYNNSNTTVRNVFDYQFVNKSAGRYPDGSFYDYNVIASEEFLEEVIAKNSKFQNIDVEKLNVEINRNEDIRQTGNVVEQRIYLSIEVSNKEFNSNNDVIEFIQAIHQNFLDRVKAKNESLQIVNVHEETSNSFLVKSFDTLTYDEIFTLISNQNSLISNDMQNFIESYGNIVVNNKTIERMKSDYDIWYGSNVNIARLQLAVAENNYIRNVSEAVRVAQLRLNQVNRSIEINTQVILELKDLLDTINLPNEVNELDVFYKEIETRTINNITLNVEKADLEKVIANTNENTDEAFENFLLGVVNNQRIVTNEYNEFKVDYLNSITVYQRFNGHKEFEVVKPFNMSLIVVVLGMVGGIIGVSTALIKEAATKKAEHLES